MSRSDSLSTSVSTHTRTDGVGPVGPLYQSVSEASTAHQQYCAEHVKSTTSQPPSSSSYGLPSESITYDCIKDQAAEDQTQPKNFEAMNAIYAGTQGDPDQFKHPTLGMEKGSMRSSGPASSYLVEPENKKRRCSRVLTFFNVFSLMAAILVAVAALALVIVMWFGIHSPSCNCTPSEGELN